MKLELLRAVVAEVSDYCHDASDVSLLGGDGGIDFDAVRVHGCQLVGLANLQLENGLIIDSGS